MSKPIYSRRQGLRRLAGIISLLLFPITLNWMSPYVSQAGAWAGVVAGSILAFGGMLVSALFLGRSFCAWVCPAGAIQDLIRPARNRRVHGGRWVKYLVWGAWFALLIVGFIRTWGPPRVQAFFMTDGGISVNRPEAFIVYYGVIGIFMAIALAVGRRGACHTICWMAPFMVIGRKLGNALRIPGLRLRSEAGRCTSCFACERACPMSLSATSMAKAGKMEHADCILCGECVDACPTGTLRYGFGKPS